MLRPMILAIGLTLPTFAAAQAPQDTITEVVQAHILPRYAALVAETETLARVAETACQPGMPELETAFHAAFDAWIDVSHITFGPAETDGRYFALSFWPDTRGMTGRRLGGLLADADPVVADPQDYATVSIAARGFYALEFLLFDPDISGMGEAEYRCALVQAITTDIAGTAQIIEAEWSATYADLMVSAGANDRFQNPDEAMRVLFGALTTGLEFTADLRLGRPLGSFDAPHPNRAEARRSGRSLRHVVRSLEALADLGQVLSRGDPVLQQAMADQFDAALLRAETLDDPVFAGVADPQARLRIEVLQQRIQDVRAFIAAELGPALGVAEGFNSLDGD